MPKREKLFILYDGRAKYEGTDDATCLVTEDNEYKARKTSNDYRGYDAIWYEYDIDPKDGTTLINEKARPDITIPGR